MDTLLPSRPYLKQILTCIALLGASQANASIIYQGPGSSYAAFEAEAFASLTNSPPTTWTVTNEPSASGGSAIYQAGVNQTSSSASFAEYSISFTQPGTYSIYYRWRADKTFTDKDPNSANSFRLPVDFGDLPNDPTSTNFATASVNNQVAVPAANAYNVWADNHTLTVTQAEVDAAVPLTFKIGTREAGMFLDRFVLSTNSTLAESDFNALLNSDTDLIVQGASDNFIAFQAERVSQILPGTANSWVVINDATAIGNRALYQQGVNQTAHPASFAYYSLKFAQAGTYSIYYRWRADKTFTDKDPNSANSFRIPVNFGDLADDPTSTNFATASVNNQVAVPAANAYNVWADSNTLTVTQDEVNSGAPLIFKIGTREAGMFLDRFVLSTVSGLGEADINALPDSGAQTPPKAIHAVGSAALTDVTVTFDKPLAAASISAGDFTLSGGVTVTGATLDPVTVKDVHLTTSAQTAGAAYTVTVTGVTDVTGNPVAAHTTAQFTAWRLSPGWVTRNFYLNVDTNNAGGGVADLLADAKYPDAPNFSDIAKDFRIFYDPSGNNYGARVRAWFTPPVSGVYQFYLYNDAAATLFLSTDATEANLAQILDSPNLQTGFDDSVSATSPSLIAGRPYLLQALFRQATGAAQLGVAAKLQSDPTPAATLTVLGGSRIATYVNPDAGVITVSRQPADATSGAGGRATFSVAAASGSNGKLYYQWRRNGNDIPNATRAVYTTPVLSAVNAGDLYDVVVSAAGASVASRQARLALGADVQSPQQPYVGVNFAASSVNGTGGVNGGLLYTNDVTGVVPQENFNNINVTSAAALPLNDVTGAPSPVTISYDSLSLVTDGTGDIDADHALFQGYLHSGNMPMTVTLGGIPEGSHYGLILYSVGFNFNATYEEQIDVTGATALPTLYVRGQDANQYQAAPKFTRMASTDPNNRDLGNYVEYDNISPAADGSLTILITPQTTNTGSGYVPPLNAIQLFKIVPVVVPPVLTAATSAGSVTLSWTAAAAGFVLQSSPALGAAAAWTPVAGAPNPIGGAGSFSVNAAVAGKRFYRLHQ